MNLYVAAYYSLRVRLDLVLLEDDVGGGAVVANFDDLEAEAGDEEHFLLITLGKEEPFALPASLINSPTPRSPPAISHRHLFSVIPHHSIPAGSTLAHPPAVGL